MGRQPRHSCVPYSISCIVPLRSLHSFPTRRSSDLFVSRTLRYSEAPGTLTPCPLSLIGTNIRSRRGGFGSTSPSREVRVRDGEGREGEGFPRKPVRLNDEGQAQSLHPRNITGARCA